MSSQFYMSSLDSTCLMFVCWLRTAMRHIGVHVVTLAHFSVRTLLLGKVSFEVYSEELHTAIAKLGEFPVFAQNLV